MLVGSGGPEVDEIPQVSFAFSKGEILGDKGVARGRLAGGDEWRS